ncbi:MAG: dNTP triphosphohydrolase, partial [Candidatus Hydrogenedentales bacterium]
MTIREQIEQREREILSPHAALAAETKGRRHPEQEHAYRTAFQRDRDRILHSKSFRRLKGKTQVFLAPEGDHYRTRLTHTLEVAQITRTAARALFLNEDLAEAIALGHDLGHTPFGHAGEAVLNEMYGEGFRHFEQSLRVVDLLEFTRHGRGLNLTEEVRDGILYHSKGKVVLQGRTGQTASTLEGRIMSVCDAIAYINHDVDDALRATFFLALPRRPAHEDPLAAGRLPWARRVVGADDRDGVDGRLNSWMPVVVKVRLVGLALGFKQCRGFLQKRRGNFVGPGFEGQADFEVLVGRWRTLAPRRSHGKQLHAPPVQQQLQLMRLPQAFDVFIAVSRQPNRELVFAVEREGVG